MLHVIVTTAIAAACAVLAAKTLACVREERLEQRRRVVAASAAGPGGLAGDAGGRIPTERRLRRFRGAAPGAKDDSPLAKRLRAAGIDMAPAWWVALSAGASVLAGACAAVVGGTPLVGCAVAAIAFAALQAGLRRRERRRRELLDVQIAHALPRIAAGVRGSLTLERALRVALVHLEEPLRAEFGRVLADASYGMPLSEALDALARRTQSEDLGTLASAARMRQGSGGSVAEALAMISARMSGRLKAARELKVEVAGTRMAKWFVAGAMPAIFLIMYATNADFARFYATEPLGWAVLAIAALSEAVGLGLSHAVTSLERR